MANQSVNIQMSVWFASILQFLRNINLISIRHTLIFDVHVALVQYASRTLFVWLSMLWFERLRNSVFTYSKYCNDNLPDFKCSLTFVNAIERLIKFETFYMVFLSDVRLLYMYTHSTSFASNEFVLQMYIGYILFKKRKVSFFVQ